MSEVIAEYSPDIEWGEQHVEIVLKQWAYSVTHTVKIGGNCRGFSVLDAAVRRLYDALAGEVDDGEPARVVLTSADGDTLLCEDDDEREEDWLKDMAVSARVVRYDPPTLNEVRARNGAAPVPDGDRPHPPL